MGQFYGNLAKIKPEYLLKATPYTTLSSVNFSKRLTKEFFFQNLYADASMEGINSLEKEIFENKVNNSLRDFDNDFAKVSVLNITGYAGSGKTTFLHHLLYENRDRIGFYEVIDYERCKRAIKPFIKRISTQLHSSENIDKLCDFLDTIAQGELLDLGNQIMYLDKLSEFSQMVRQNDIREVFQYINLIESFASTIRGNSKRLSFLFLIVMLILLFDKFNSSENSDFEPMILVIDNCDSMSNLSEERLFLTTFKDFILECNNLFSNNLNNDLAYNRKVVSDVFDKTKLVVFLTTRLVTHKRFAIIEPDCETIDGWQSVRLPETYYDHKDIIDKRIKYYESAAVPGEEETVKELQMIHEVANIAYRNWIFMRLYNGNVRMCVERLCNMSSIFRTNILREFLELNKEKPLDPDAVEGSRGIFLYMLLQIFKDDNVYEEKLNLNPCKKDGTVSLSRIILTILRENEGRCSLYRIFDILVKHGFSSNDICNTVWNLCEGNREVWRRLLVFDSIVPESVDNLLLQAKQFDNGNTNMSAYSDLVICTAGLAYMEYVIPHFEFMLSRHEMRKDSNRALLYQPLFAKSSEQKYDENTYVFEKKIETVYNDVRDCCYNSSSFANRVMEKERINRYEYIYSSPYNYHSVSWHGQGEGKHHSYESRLIFRHITYIEKYRCYLLKKHEFDMDENLRADINRRLVDKIVKYIKLYNNYDICFQTEDQDMVVNELHKRALIIINKKYHDFETKIET